MVPGMPTTTPGASSTPPKKSLASLPPPSLPASTAPVLDGAPPGMLASLTETWEEVRDAVAETDTAIALSKHLSRAAKVAAKAWYFSKGAAWVLGTSALVLVVPLLYEIDKEIGPGPDLPPAAQTDGGPAAADATQNAAAHAGAAAGQTADAGGGAQAAAAKSS